MVSCISDVTTLHALAALVQVGTPERSFLELFAKINTLRVATLVERVGRLLDQPRKGGATSPTELHDIVAQAQVSADGAYPMTGPQVLLQMLLDEKNDAAIVSLRATAVSKDQHVADTAACRVSRCVWQVLETWSRAQLSATVVANAVHAPTWRQVPVHLSYVDRRVFCFKRWILEAKPTAVSLSKATSVGFARDLPSAEWPRPAVWASEESKDSDVSHLGVTVLWPKLLTHSIPKSGDVHAWASMLRAGVTTVLDVSVTGPGNTWGEQGYLKDIATAMRRLSATMTKGAQPRPWAVEVLHFPIARTPGTEQDLNEMAGLPSQLQTPPVPLSEGVAAIKRRTKGAGKVRCFAPRCCGSVPIAPCRVSLWCLPRCDMKYQVFVCCYSGQYRSRTLLHIVCMERCTRNECALLCDCCAGMLVKTALEDAVKDPVERTRLVGLLETRA